METKPDTIHITASLGMDIQHSKTRQINVEIEYRVSGF
jgi:hypothetical protein